MSKQHNYAFIDGNNLILGLRDQGWKLNYQKFFHYLKDKYRVEKAFWFIGYLRENEALYQDIKRAGFELVFKETVIDKFGKVKGNVDVLLTVTCFEMLEQFDGMILVSGDGDFDCLVDFFAKRQKFTKLFLPSMKSKSSLLNKFKRYFLPMNLIRNKIEYTKK